MAAFARTISALAASTSALALTTWACIWATWACAASNAALLVLDLLLQVRHVHLGENLAFLHPVADVHGLGLKIARRAGDQIGRLEGLDRSRPGADARHRPFERMDDFHTDFIGGGRINGICNGLVWRGRCPCQVIRRRPP